MFAAPRALAPQRLPRLPEAAVREAGFDVAAMADVGERAETRRPRVHARRAPAPPRDAPAPARRREPVRAGGDLLGARRAAARQRAVPLRGNRRRQERILYALVLHRVASPAAVRRCAAHIAQSLRTIRQAIRLPRPHVVLGIGGTGPHGRSLRSAGARGELATGRFGAAALRRHGTRALGAVRARRPVARTGQTAQRERELVAHVGRAGEPARRAGGGTRFVEAGLPLRAP